MKNQHCSISMKKLIVRFRYVFAFERRRVYRSEEHPHGHGRDPSWIGPLSATWRPLRQSDLLRTSRLLWSSQGRPDGSLGRRNRLFVERSRIGREEERFGADSVRWPEEETLRGDSAHWQIQGQFAVDFKPREMLKCQSIEERWTNYHPLFSTKKFRNGDDLIGLTGLLCLLLVLFASLSVILIVEYRPGGTFGRAVEWNGPFCSSIDLECTQEIQSRPHDSLDNAFHGWSWRTWRRHHYHGIGKSRLRRKSTFP